MNIFDGHSDIWTDVTIRTLRGENDILRKYHLEKLKKGKIAGSIFVIWIDPPYTNEPYQRSMQIVDAIKRELESCKDSVVIVKSFKDIERAIREEKFYILIGLEGLSSIGENLDFIDFYYDMGARHASLTWNEENSLATGVCGSPDRGLTSLGKKALKIIERKNMILDVSHLNEKSFWDVMRQTDRPVIASHSNCKALCDVPRNLNDEQLKEISKRNGLVGINSFNEFVHQEPQKQTVEMLVRHVVHMVEVMGIDHVGFGMDYFDFLDDGVTNSFCSQDTAYTVGLEDASKTYRVIDELRKVGFTQNEIDKIAYQNFHRIIREVIK